MSVPFTCLAILIVLVIATKLPVAVAMKKQGKGRYDNRTPRSQQAALTGWGARALGAHQNTFEALIIFTPAVLIATVAGGEAATETAATLAMVHIGARILYPVLYIADVHVVRSLVWGVGFISAVWMAFLPLAM